MAVELIHLNSSPRVETGDGAIADFIYIANGTEDEAEVRAALNEETEPTYDIGIDSPFLLPRTRISVEPIGQRGPGDIQWECHVIYATRSLTPLDSGDFEFDTSGGTAHVTQAKGVIATLGEMPDTGGAIGVTKDGVEGTDIVVPVFNFSETHRKQETEVDETYRILLFSLTGTVNNGPFRGFAAGEVLFLGASGRKSGQHGPFELTYKFAASPNVTGLTIGDITGISKLGWEYIDIRYEDIVDEDVNALVKYPIGVQIVRNYDYTDFDLLGIG